MKIGFDIHLQQYYCSYIRIYLNNKSDVVRCDNNLICNIYTCRVICISCTAAYRVSVIVLVSVRLDMLCFVLKISSKRCRCFVIAEIMKIIERLESDVSDKYICWKLETVNQSCLPYGSQTTKLKEFVKKTSRLIREFRPAYQDVE
jgi:hypothetical protein